MKIGECSSCEGWIYWSESLIKLQGKEYCYMCYEELKEDK